MKTKIELRTNNRYFLHGEETAAALLFSEKLIGTFRKLALHLGGANFDASPPGFQCQLPLEKEKQLFTTAGHSAWRGLCYLTKDL